MRRVNHTGTFKHRHRLRDNATMSRMWWGAAWLLLAIAPAAMAQELVAIEEIVARPDIYHLHQVVIQGTVRDVQALPPYKLPTGDFCYGAFLFRLEDDTGSVAVALLGICDKPILRELSVSEGDQAAVQATIHAPGHGGYYLSLQGLRISTEEQGEIQAVAANIVRLDP